MSKHRSSLVVQWLVLKLSLLCPGFNPWLVTKVLQALWCGQKIKIIKLERPDTHRLRNSG